MTYLLFVLFLLLLGVLIFAFRPTRPKTYAPGEWLAAGGVLGLAIFLSRLTRMPLASLLTALPFLLGALRRAEEKQQVHPHQPAMTREEAALILGISVQAPPDDIERAHRRLIQKNHPDLGGTDYLAAKINQARDVLLRR